MVHDNDGLLVANNLLSGPELRNESASQIIFRQNVEKELTEIFVDPAGGDLHLKGMVDGISDNAVYLSEAAEDIDGQSRSGTPDIGADELP